MIPLVPIFSLQKPSKNGCQASNRFMIRIRGQGTRWGPIILEVASHHISQPVLLESWLFWRELHTLPKINPKSTIVRCAKVQCVVRGSEEGKSLCDTGCEVLISISWVVNIWRVFLKWLSQTIFMICNLVIWFKNVQCLRIYVIYLGHFPLLLSIMVPVGSMCAYGWIDRAQD